MITTTAYPSLRTTVLAALLVLTFACLAPTSASGATSKGIVVERDNARSFLIANAKGALESVNARRAPKVGSRVALRGRRQAQGSFKARRVKVKGHARRARVRGTVSFINRASRSYVLAGKGGSLTVKAPTKLQVGDVAVVVVSISRDADLSQKRARVIGQADSFEVEGTLEAFDAAAGTLTIRPEEDDDDLFDDDEDLFDEGSSDEGSSDEDDATEVEDAEEVFPTGLAVIAAPQGFDFSLCNVGQEIEVEVTFDEVNGYVLAEEDDSDDSEDASSSNACGDSDDVDDVDDVDDDVDNDDDSDDDDVDDDDDDDDDDDSDE